MSYHIVSEKAMYPHFYVLNSLGESIQIIIVGDVLPFHKNDTFVQSDNCSYIQINKLNL